MYWQKNHQFLPDDTAVISLNDRAFLYGDGCFTTAQVYNGTISLRLRHQQRLQQAIDALFLDCDMTVLMTQADQFLHNVALQSDTPLQTLCGTLKIVISRGLSARGYAIPEHQADGYYYFYPQPCINHPTILPIVGIVPQPLGDEFAALRGLKTLNRLPQVWLKHYATAQHWNEAICLNRLHDVVEGIAANVFFLLDGVWCTPDLAYNGIDGVMRQEIVARLKQAGISYAIGAFSLQQLMQADEMFLCNSLHPIQMVTQLDVQKIAGCHANRSLNQVECRRLYAALQLSQA